MKTLTTYSSMFVTVFSFLIFMMGNGYAATYTTLANGSWSNTTNVWSTDGVSPCGCSPGTNVNNQTINILHNITFALNLRFGANTQVFIQQNRTLSSGPTINIDVFDSYWNIEGNVITGNLYTRSGGVNIFLNSGGSIQTSQSFEMQGGFVHVRSAYIRSSSSVSVSTTSTLRLSHGSKFEALNSFNNYGILTVEPGSCVSSVGTFQNNAGAFVYGAGSIVSIAGNVRNELPNPLTNFSAGISWCGAGGSLNLPTLSNCALANSTCNGIVLPIEMSSFTVELKNELYTEINWSTASENNNAYFRVMKLSEGNSNWKEIETVDGSGTTSETMYYRSVDKNVQMGVTYYRLIQVDNDGKENYSDVLSINRSNSGPEIVLYPNPASQNEQIVLNNLKKTEGNISVYDLNGNLIYNEEKSSNADFHVISTDKISSGIYSIRVFQQNELQTLKLVVQ